MSRAQEEMIEASQGAVAIIANVLPIAPNQSKQPGGNSETF